MISIERTNDHIFPDSVPEHLSERNLCQSAGVRSHRNVVQENETAVTKICAEARRFFPCKIKCLVCGEIGERNIGQVACPQA